MEKLQMKASSVACPVSAQLRHAAEALAAQIERGYFSELTADQRCDLRRLPMAMAEWADLVETMEHALIPVPPRYIQMLRCATQRA